LYFSEAIKSKTACPQNEMRELSCHVKHIPFKLSRQKQNIPPAVFKLASYFGMDIAAL